MTEPERICLTCGFLLDGWQKGEAGQCASDGEYHDLLDRCDFWQQKLKLANTARPYTAMDTEEDSFE